MACDEAVHYSGHSDPLAVHSYVEASVGFDATDVAPCAYPVVQDAAAHAYLVGLNVGPDAVPDADSVDHPAVEVEDHEVAPALVVVAAHVAAVDCRDYVAKGTVLDSEMALDDSALVAEAWGYSAGRNLLVFSSPFYNDELFPYYNKFNERLISSALKYFTIFTLFCWSSSAFPTKNGCLKSTTKTYILRCYAHK